MRQLLVMAPMLGALVATGGNPALATDRVVLVGCDLLGPSGPTAVYRQSGGASQSGFVGGSRDDAVRGRDCAQVLAEVAAAGLEFREFQVIGLDFAQGIWFWETP